MELIAREFLRSPALQDRELPLMILNLTIDGWLANKRDSSVEMSSDAAVSPWCTVRGIKSFGAWADWL